ncbi:MAG: hypothetical protein PHC61_11130 [Chitinivibrionales bacterium]|nr:hypothetical protein [Chitinivibrionales bacterium]
MPKSPTPMHCKEQLARLFKNQPELAHAIQHDAVKPAFLKQIVSFSEDDQRALVSLFAAFSLSHQTQAQWLQWLPEIAYSSGSSIAEILKSDAIKNICNDDKRNNPQKIQSLHEALFALRFPLYTQMLAQWELAEKELNPDRQQVRFTPSAAFEKNKLEVAITVTDGKKARALFKKLSEIGAASWEKLIYPINF